ncbi:unnamed protein product [Lactuca virosa]|uniref:Uncharacterized protein n=1 Tax=Lactuca virosa TaxID=75947 RepID=A0AAU9P1M3_9ASTR|nr:unnamed protein product [Lactuca virosa]
MAGSSETPSAADKTASLGLLGIKAIQNLILDIDPSKCDAFLQPLIECLRYSPLATALSKTENFPLALLSKAYSSDRYQESSATITFELGNLQTTITKSRFSRLMGFL